MKKVWNNKRKNLLCKLRQKMNSIAVELGFSINPYEITDDGVLRSSAMNLL